MTFCRRHFQIQLQNNDHWSVIRIAQERFFTMFHILLHAIYRGRVKHDTAHNTTTPMVKLWPHFWRTKNTHISHNLAFVSYVEERDREISAAHCSDNSWVQTGGPVTTESIVRFDTWFELFEVFRKNLAPMTLAKMAAEFVRSQNLKWPPAAILEM